MAFRAGLHKLPVALLSRTVMSGPVKSTGLSSRRAFYFVAGSAFAATLAYPTLVKYLPESITDHFSSTLSNTLDNDESPIVRLIPPEVIDNLRISRSVPGPNPLPGRRLVLLQYQSCPFCCKVRTFLEYNGIPYDVVEVNPVLRQQLRFSPYRKVPVVLIQNQSTAQSPSDHVLQLNDSSTIISILGTFLARQTLLTSSSSSSSSSPSKDDFEHSGDDLLDIARSYRELVYASHPHSHDPREVANRYFLMLGDLWTNKQYRQIEDDLMEERKWRKWADDVLGNAAFSHSFL
jgi:glutaredoxin